jgi:hypothetical protein
MTFGRKRAGNALSPTQRAALVKLAQGALPWINRAFDRKRACPSTWISFVTASALVRGVWRRSASPVAARGSGSLPPAASMPRRWLNWLKRRIAIFRTR